MDPIRPNRRGQRRRAPGWHRGAEARNREDRVHRGEAESELSLDEYVEGRDQLACAERCQEARQQRQKKSLRSRITRPNRPRPVRRTVASRFGRS